MKDISIVIAGAAGQGIQSVEEFLVGIFKSAGFHVFATKEYMSRVRGGVNSTEIRVSSNPVSAYVHRIDLLIPLSKESLKHLNHRISNQTRILTDPASIEKESVQKCKDGSLKQEGCLDNVNTDFVFSIAMEDIANEVGNKIYANVVAVGVVVGIFGINQDVAIELISDKFQAKGDDIVKGNLMAFEKGYEKGTELHQKQIFKLEMTANPTIKDDIILSGVDAVGLGAIAGGCNFISAYPMSPSTGLLTFLAQQSNTFEIVVDQAEDEIAAINKTIGAWYAGARAIASSAGGGFALMTEGISLAGMIESPLVVHIAQRPAPATGLPTRTAQEDLTLALYAGHGEFPRVILAPGTLEQAFYLTQMAFNLADKYQVPVFILTDQYFVDSYYDIKNLDLSNFSVQHAFVKTTTNYQRYKITKNGISPRGIPGFGEGLVRVDSDEHDEDGQITEDTLKTRPAMVEKRLFKKGKELINEIIAPTLVGIEGSSNFNNLIICWGSNYNIVKEAIDRVNNPYIAMLHFSQLYPLSPTIESYFEEAQQVFIVENNATGQFANLIKAQLDYIIPNKNRLLKYSGDPFSVEEIIEFINSKVSTRKGGTL
jgi:2-oxoglutarate ferredoxin oxidoreductase subunit alpha